MKRVFAVLFTIVLACSLAVPAFANDGGPAFSAYTAVCPKKTDYYVMDEDKMVKVGTFPAGSELQVYYEYEHKGTVYSDVELDGQDYYYVYVKRADLQLKDENYLPENGVRLEESVSVCVTAPDGIKMYKGPHTFYPVVTTIPKNIRLTYSVANSGSYEGQNASWAYVTYRQYSGWIYIFRRDVENGVAEYPQVKDDAQVWVLEDGVQMYKGISYANLQTAMHAQTVAEYEKCYKENGYGEYYEPIFEGTPDKVVGTLRKGMKYKFRYAHDCNFGTWYYVTAGLRAGWVFMGYNESRIAVRAPEYYSQFRKAFRSFELELSDDPNSPDVFSTVTVSKDMTLSPQFFTRSDSYDCIFYETIDGKSGWWKEDHVVNENTVYILSDDGDKYYFDQYIGQEGGTPVYSDIVRRDKQIGTIPAGEHPEILYNGGYSIPQRLDMNDVWQSICYIRYKDLDGWVLRDDLFCPQEETETDAEEPSAEERTPETEDEWALDAEDTPEDVSEADAGPEEAESEEDNGFADDFTVEKPMPQHSRTLSRCSLTPGQIVLACIGGAVVPATLATTALLLIRKKRKAGRAPEPQADLSADDDQTDTREL